jgi:hypothetical protein
MMFRKIIIFLLIFLLSYVAVFSALAWVEPTVAPPGNNVEAPINAGAAGQTKLGTFSATQFIDANNPSYYLDPSGDSLLLGKLQVTNTQIWDNEINRTNNTNLYIGYRNTTNTVLQPNGGSVGIGTASPAYPLHVAGSIGTNGQGQNFVARYDTTESYKGTFGWNHLQLGNNGTNDIIAGRTNTGGYLRFYVNATNDYTYNNSNGTLAMTIGSDGNVNVAKNLTVSGQFSAAGADLAEEFETSDNWPAGTVLVMADNGFKSARPCEKEYDTRVLGVVSDNVSVVMGKIIADKKVAVALTGVVRVKVNGPIEKGDLLTTSRVKGYAMKAKEPKPGTIIGKALEDLFNEQGEVMALVNLQ